MYFSLLLLLEFKILRREKDLDNRLQNIEYLK